MPRELTDDPAPSKPPARRCVRWARRAGATLAAVAVGWVILAIYPQPLFAHEARLANVVVHARAPMPPETAPLLEDVVRRVSRSPLYDPRRVHHVFLCDTPALFATFALWDRKVGAIAQVHLGGNVFIRPSSIVRNRVIGPSGLEKPGDRTLAYFIAHELAHAMTADQVGRWRYFSLAAFQQEGYADYVAFARPVDLARGREALLRGDHEMSPRASGLYARYELLVAHLLDRRGLTVEQLLAGPMDPRAVERELLAWAAPP
jgi:hypothetical protein